VTVTVEIMCKELNQNVKAKPNLWRVTVTVEIMCKELNQNVKAKVKLCIYERCNTGFSDQRLGSDITEQEAKDSTCVLHDL
jgi:hypothetical protein